MYTPIDKSFFEAPVLELAKKLVGQYIVHEQPEGTIVVRIVETEAYHGPRIRRHIVLIIGERSGQK